MRRVVVTGLGVISSVGVGVPAFAEALEPGQGAAFARATTVLRELAVALGACLLQDRRERAPHMLEVAGDLLEQFVKGWF